MGVKTKFKTEYEETIEQLCQVYEEEGFEPDEEMKYLRENEEQEIYIDPLF